MKCISCLRGRRWECLHQGACDGVDSGNLFDDSSNSGDSSNSNNGEVEGRESATGIRDMETEKRISSDGPVREISTYKSDAALRDQQSTGRKRAAEMYPLTEDKECEWRAKKNCGGGDHPIVGCINGTQEARHHGPDKNTLNNEHGNVHRVCHKCHNRWHASNDESYVWEGIHSPHSPIDADLDDLLQNEVYWGTRKIKKVRD